MQNSRLDRALEFTTSMMSTRDLDELLNKILDIVTQDFGFEGCDIFLLDKEKDQFVLKATKGFSQDVRSRVDKLTKTREELAKDLDDCEKLARFTYFFRGSADDDPATYFSLLHPERVGLPRKEPNDWHELDVLYIALENQRGEIVGFIQPDGPKDLKIPTETIVMNLEVFASLASIAVSNAEIVGELNRNIMFYKTLAKTTAALQEPVGLKDTLRKVADSMSAIVMFDEISVYLVDWEKSLLVPVYAKGPWANEIMVDIGPISGLSGEVARTGRTEIVDNSNKDPRVEDIPGVVDDEIGQSMMCIPLKSKAGEVEGILALYRNHPMRFTRTELEITEPFATHAAIALENARLRDELKANFESVQKAFDDMRALDKAKDSLVNTISHELRTPLTTVLGYLEMASEGMYGDVSPKMRDKIQAMVKSVNRINALVGKMLEMSRLQDGTLALDIEPVNLSMLTKEVVKELETDINSRGHILTVMFGNQLPVVEADRMRIHDVLFNLLHNAIRYTEEGGKITIGADILGGKVHVWVKDTGRGISEEDRPKIFSRFFLADEGLIREDGRVGIGLYVSREIIRKHLGDMWFESREGSGSTFHLTLPLKQKSLFNSA